ncbi:hypothetical protein GCM10022253_02060 [Sphingomonas endophytica]|uniref:Asparagine N-glycosylation enzyme membrane subunit Stt3 n=1 Tax=Sphingomonas endophytica TaxID=869719 RepID=A0A7X0JFB7_9SPHN|nr:hypothetical protein [Sphingomonas endophytica]MBB5725358.1 asparagine N-glycosylation enzyme membrane subunit Stt3 [Sphingomonas endophytica]MBB6505602.1 asparagine N-glycosylation enzyme membrane subunit Stt3 [Sphingomonas endophytica]
MTVVILMVLAIVVAGAAAAWVLRWGALKAAGAVGLLGATAMIVAMLASVSARFEAVAITFAGTFVGVALLALLGAGAAALLRPRARIA